MSKQKDNNQESKFLTDEELGQELQKCSTQEERDKLVSDQMAIRLGAFVWAAIIFFVIILVFGIIIR